MVLEYTFKEEPLLERLKLDGINAIIKKELRQYHLPSKIDYAIVNYEFDSIFISKSENFQNLH